MLPEKDPVLFFYLYVVVKITDLYSNEKKTDKVFNGFKAITFNQLMLCSYYGLY